MPNPKRKHSKCRRDKSRTHWKLSHPNGSKCSHCGEMKLPHRVCPHCGYYNGRQVSKPSKK
ncbi:MAG: 50S ribosomal protein L32 [bacterium]